MNHDALRLRDALFHVLFFFAKTFSCGFNLKCFFAFDYVIACIRAVNYFILGSWELGPIFISYLFFFSSMSNFCILIMTIMINST